MAVSKRTRFEVLRRDNFTCRYCRSTAGELTVDHVTPTALGGSDDPDNLVAACADCNAGKASTSPDDALVADVAHDSARWSAAMQQAAAEADAQRARDTAVLAAFQADFHYWLPIDWEPTVTGWLRSGLTVSDATDILNTALAKQYIHHDAVFSYACGIARNKVRALHERARAILDAGGAA